MNSKKSHPSRRLQLKVTAEEYETLKRKSAASTCRSLSEYSRKLLFKNPVTVFYRNRSLDELIEELIIMRNEIEAVHEQLPLNAFGETRFIELTSRIQERMNQIADHVVSISK